VKLLKLTPDKLKVHLKSALAPVYLVVGDEPLQREEATDAIRAAARKCGYKDREVFFVERGFDWNQFTAAGTSLSLFAAKRVLEVRLPSGKPGDDGAAALSAYAQNPAPDTLLLVITAKLERGGGRWAEALEHAGAMVNIWPVEPGNLPRWIERRMQDLGLIPAPEAVSLIVERIEGNLLAAAQEVDKLLLLHGPGPVDAAAAREAVADSARYDPYALVDAALAGDRRRTVRILKGLEEEGAQPTFVLWALTSEIRKLAILAWNIRGGLPLQRALAGVWEKRRPLIQKALGRHQHQDWQRLLVLAARVDRVIKGRSTGRSWDELLNLSVSLAGIKLPA
jgi:DNA polymerase III subunit delta